MALIFVAFSALELFLTWRDLGRPYLPARPFELFFFAVALAECLIFMRMFKCFGERFVIGVATLIFVRTLINGFVPRLITPIAAILRHAFVVLWILALVISLSMFAQTAQNPYVAPDDAETKLFRRRLLILSAVIVGALFLGALMYFVPKQ